MRIVVKEGSPFQAGSSCKVIRLVFTAREQAVLVQASGIAESARELIWAWEAEHGWDGDPFNEDVDMNLFHVAEAGDMRSGFKLTVPA